MASAGTKIQDELWKLRLSLLQEKLKRGRDRIKAYDQQLSDSQAMDHTYRESPRISKIDREMKRAKRRQQELKDLISQERMLNILQRPSPAWPERHPPPPPPPPEPPKADPAGKKDRFEQVMEMMMLQHTQTQNMIMNQLLLDNNKSRHSAAVQPPPPPVTLPPIYPPMPYLYPPYSYPLHQPSEPRPVSPPSSEAKSYRRPVKPHRPYTVNYSFPGNDSQRKIRQLGYAAIFCSHLQKQSKRNNFRPQVGFLFELKLKEIVSALHRLYVSQDGKIYEILKSSIFNENSFDFDLLLDTKSRLTVDEQKRTLQALAYAVENIIYHITEIMPAKGVLGTHRKALVFDLIRSDQKFPENYFYSMEREMLLISLDNRTVNVTDDDAGILLFGAYLDRALIQSLLAKPVDYGVTNRLDAKSENNVRVFASVLFYIYRRVIANLCASKNGVKKGTKIDIPPMPPELSHWLHSDDVILTLIKKLKKSIDYAEGLVLPWCQEYVKRLRNAAF